jgi:hypothetical protein
MENTNTNAPETKPAKPRRLYNLAGTLCLCFKGKLYAPERGASTAFAATDKVTVDLMEEGVVAVSTDSASEEWAEASRDEIKSRKPAKVAPAAAVAA